MAQERWFAAVVTTGLTAGLLTACASVPAPTSRPSTGAAAKFESEFVLAMPPGTVLGDGSSAVDRQGIRRTVAGHGAELRYCYEEALEKTPMLEGRLVLSWTFDDTGAVGEVRVKSAGARIEPVVPCVLARVKAWKFQPAAPKGQVVEVSYPFFFSENGKRP